MSPADKPTGINIRQALDPNSPVFTLSPDLIVTGTAAALDASNFTDPSCYKWYFSQAPVIGSPNYFYIRGLNWNEDGTQNSTVYFYFAQSDQVLDPTKWQSTGFTVNGTAQNSAPIDAQNEYDYVATSPIMWTPPQPTTSGATYYLISWIDNSSGNQRPKLPTTPFADMAALGTYLKQNPQVAILDTIYRGAFLRQFPGQTVGQDGTGAQTCPDIIVAGPAAVQDASSFAGQGSYSPGSVSATAALGMRNFIYVRAINTATATAAQPATARVYLFWTSASAPAAPNWQATNFTFAGRTQNWVDLTATAQNQVMISTVPLVWNAPDASGGPYMLIAYVDNSVSGKPPDFTPFGYLNAQMVAQFVAGHPQLAWVAVTDSKAAQPTMSWDVSLPNIAAAATVYVGVQLRGIPTDGTFSLSIPGPDGINTITVQGLPVPNPQVAMVWPVTYPQGFQSSAVLAYTQGKTPVAGGGIDFTMLTKPAG